MQENIIIKGARENNLKNIDVVIPRDRLTVVTASGSRSPAAFFVLKMLVSVFRHGSSINPKKR